MGVVLCEGEGWGEAAGDPNHIEGPSIDVVTNVSRLREYWGRQFVPVATDRRLVGAFARVFSPKLSGLPMAEPRVEDVTEALEHASPSAPGPDGLPYTAWLRGGVPAAHVLLLLHQSMASSGVAPPAFGASVAVFLPKGAQESDELMTGRRDRMASSTGPLALYSTDHKKIAAVASQPLRQRLPRSGPRMQYGFVRGRTTITQIVGLETAARRDTILASGRALEAGWHPPRPEPAGLGEEAERVGVARPPAHQPPEHSAPSRRWWHLQARESGSGVDARQSSSGAPDAGCAAGSGRASLRADLSDPQLDETPFVFFLDFATAFPSACRAFVIDA